MFNTLSVASCSVYLIAKVITCNRCQLHSRFKSIATVWEAGVVRLVLEAWHVSTIIRSWRDKRAIVSTLVTVPLALTWCLLLSAWDPLYHVTTGGGLPERRKTRKTASRAPIKKFMNVKQTSFWMTGQIDIAIFVVRTRYVIDSIAGIIVNDNFGSWN